MRFPLATTVLLFINLAITGAGATQSTSAESRPTPYLSSLPDAPSAAILNRDYHAPSGEKHPAVLWDGEISRSNREVFKNKPYLFTVLTDVASGVFDAEMSHEGYAHHRCIEGGEGLGRYATRGALYRNNLPEQLFVIGYGFIATKAKMPSWLMPVPVIYAVQSHLRAGLQWWQNCW